MAYYKTRNTGIPNKGTQNTGGTAEHPGTPAEHPEIPTEHQRNSSGPPRNNGTIQNTTKNNCSHFKENLNLTLIHLTLSTQGGNIFYY